MMRWAVSRPPNCVLKALATIVSGIVAVSALDRVFYDTLLDENAASHIALGQGFPFLITEDDRGRANESQIHIDFMIGRPEMHVTGITADGDRVPVLVEGKWQI